MAIEKIKFAIIGYGNIGKRHAEHILENENAELVGVCDVEYQDASIKYQDESSKNINRQTVINIKGKEINFYKKIEELLKDTNADVINICTPNYLHAQHTIASLKAGKHVVCEKPMSTSVADSEAMIKAATQYNKKIFVVKQNRYNPPVQQVKKLITQNKLGKILLVNINCFWNRNELYYNSNWRGDIIKDGGCLYTQFSHFVDILYYLCGYCTPINSVMQNSIHPKNTIEDNGICTLQTKDGGLVNFNFSTCSYKKNMEGAITIIAENGTIKIGGQYLNTIEYQCIENIELEPINIIAKSNDYGLYQGSMSNHDKMIDNVINTLHGTDTIMTNAQEGRDVVRMIEEMYRVSGIENQVSR
jgi:UDP-N-acetyl-2-amino-2-deoxyglucuronate dehydrogenase